MCLAGLCLNDRVHRQDIQATKKGGCSVGPAAIPSVVVEVFGAIAFL